MKHKDAFHGQILALGLRVFDMEVLHNSMENGSIVFQGKVWKVSWVGDLPATLERQMVRCI